MAEHGETSAIVISLIVGALLSFLFDNVFVLVFIGFLSTYMTNSYEKKYTVGVVTAVIYAALNFSIGMVTIPNIPPEIIVNIGFDPLNFIIGIIVTLAIAGILGFIGGFIAEEAYTKNKKTKRKENKKK